MYTRHRILVWVVSLTLISAALVGIATAAVPIVKGWWKSSDNARSTFESVVPVPGQTNAFTISEDVARRLGIKSVEVHEATTPIKLEMTGTLALDNDYYVRIRPRFPGELIQIGTIEIPDPDHPGKTIRRAIRFGDQVKGPVVENGKVVRLGDLLAVIWNKDLGEKKSELVTSIIQYSVDQETYQRMLEYKNVLPEQTIRDKGAVVAQDFSNVLRAERTLQVWRLSKEEIDAVKQEAQSIYKRTREQLLKGGDPLKTIDSGRAREWGNVEVRAPFDGTVLEKNTALGDMIQDVTVDLYKIADLRHLAVWAHAYEEDLPKLLRLPVSQRIWTVNVIAPDAKEGELKGAFTKIGDIIDPNQRTALVLGHVENPSGNLRAGQFVTAVVNLPPDPDAVEVPTAALLENGTESTVLVQVDPHRNEYEVRRVAVERRTETIVSVRTRLTAAEKARGLQTLRPGEYVVTQAALQVVAAFKEQQDAANAAAKKEKK
jgi:cobalt-zinc-cadmium efflux system membrane fusion protein